MSTVDPSLGLEQLVQEWLRLDKNDTTRDEIQTLWNDHNTEELDKRLRHRIQFGTAGLRGKMEAGFSRMNDLIIIQASQGLCAYTLKNISDAHNRGVVVGYDHRHNSERWAMLTAAVFIANNMKVYLLRGYVHTPMVPFALKRLRAACGVMITASHNPKDDNGYKVYWENAVQIIEPHDKGISDSIRVNSVPQEYGSDLSAVLTSPLCIDPTEEMHQNYLSCLSSLSRTRITQTEVKFVNTSMHGVGYNILASAVKIAGHCEFLSVREQEAPDPEFPTVQFPNPEEKGKKFCALDLAIAMANNEGAQYVLAQDPDADRFAAAQKGPNGQWMIFTGDQLGTLFAAWTLESYKASGKPLSKLAMVASTVSSKMIAAMADAEGFRFVDCLTGFKYIGNMALKLVHEGYDVPFGYEEAIGFMFGNEIRDKDGVAAAIVFLEIVTSLQSEGKTAYSYLQELYQRYGYFKTSNSYFVCREPAIIDGIFSRLRNYSGADTRATPNYPEAIAGLAITMVRDLTIGYDSSNPPTYRPTLPLSSGHMIQFKAGSPSNIGTIFLTLRTSGTEPKIKYYLEGSGTNASQVASLLSKVVSELSEDWVQADKNKLSGP